MFYVIQNGGEDGDVFIAIALNGKRPDRHIARSKNTGFKILKVFDAEEDAVKFCDELE
ncbi:hypothetical protein [Paenibacillus sp. L3-i20]|uniref:hypothetical protein n=1 Tax=Paenibacillus sp. L3-i20 TaxID=2905833 RepID=UPI001EDCF481|nr:hypothetical protein [Paenibacillus sp. L3-i20]GKU76863.1 hypothetical protein L3i20_v212600 [Paenibacillus sp. L3-i20]